MRNKRNDVLINSIASSKIKVLLTALIVFIIATTFAQAAAPGSVGVYDPNTGQWAVGNDPANAEVFGFGWADTEPIVGDWNGDGIDEVGVYNREGNNFVIKNGANYDVIGLGWDDVTPLVGDWNGDGKDDVGVRGPYGQWALWNSNTDSADILGEFGGFGSKAIVGDWNGDGKDDVGVYNPFENYFVIKNGARYDRIHLGWNDVIPMVGDWNGDGMDDIGVYDPNTGQWAVGNDPTTARIFGFGWAGTEPIVVDWNGDGTDEVGVYNRAGNNFLIQNGASYYVIGLGWNGVIPLVGDWSTEDVTKPTTPTTPTTPTAPITPTDKAPILAAIGAKSVNEGSLLSFTISAKDPDGDKVTYSATGLPSGARLDASTGRFTWTPGSGTADKYTVKFIATANGQTDSETVTITVKAAELKDYIPSYSDGSEVEIKNSVSGSTKITVVWTKIGSKNPVFVVNIPYSQKRTVEIPAGTFDEYVLVTYSAGHQWYDAGTDSFKSGYIYSIEYYMSSGSGGLPEIPDSEAPNI